MFLIDCVVGASHIMIETQSSIDEFAHIARRDDVVGPDKRTLKEACYLLLNCSLFGGLRPDERAEVVALARVRTFNAGETVFAIGSPGDQMMALLSGTIRISVPSPGGKELLLASDSARRGIRRARGSRRQRAICRRCCGDCMHGGDSGPA